MIDVLSPTPAVTTPPAPIATAAAGGGVTGAAVVLVVYVLGMFKITVPAEVAAAMMVVIAPFVHWAALWMQKETPKVLENA